MLLEAMSPLAVRTVTAKPQALRRLVVGLMLLGMLRLVALMRTVLVRRRRVVTTRGRRATPPPPVRTGTPAPAVLRPPEAEPTLPEATLPLAAVGTMPTPRTMRADVPEELERVLAVGMAKDPRERFQSAIEFARALQSIQGLINQPVTSIDVFTEPGQVLDDESELLDEGTRISGFQLIDPDRPDSTSHATGPTSGTTAPDQSGFSTGGHGAYTVPGPVLQHGRGVAAPGLRGKAP